MRQEREMEKVVQFKVTLSWGDEYNDRGIGLRSAVFTTETVGTSTQAIVQAQEALRCVREDEPRKVNVDVKTFERELPRKIGNGSTVIEVESRYTRDISDE